MSEGRDLGEDLLARAATLAPRLTELRRAIHRRPEIGLHTPATQERIEEELAHLARLTHSDGSPVRCGRGCSSLVTDIRGARADGPTVLLRADMDALPVVERSGVDFASQTDGAMHACGHDVHAAMLLGAGELLGTLRDRFAGSVRLMFQPGEEGCGGARVMIDEGVLEGVEAAFALHVDPGRPVGAVASREGTFLAGFDDFTVTFLGSGGHASTPHAARDPIAAIGPFVDGLAHVAARETDPDDRAVLSVTKVRAGSAHNVIPAAAACAGTIRSLSREGGRLARERLERVAAGVAASRDLSAEIQLSGGYPPTINHSSVVGAVGDACAQLGIRYETMPSPYMGAEDFSYVLERVPGAMAFIGCRSPGTGPLHSDRLLVDEKVLPLGASLLAAVAMRLLSAA